jgi:hypothetical protein
MGKVMFWAANELGTSALLSVWVDLVSEGRTRAAKKIENAITEVFWEIAIFLSLSFC